VEPTGKLELTWANKELRLLSHGSDTYEWVEPSDYRVTEVRPLRRVETVGEPGSGNPLIKGDAAHALDALLKVPALAGQYRGCEPDPVVGVLAVGPARVTGIRDRHGTSLLFVLAVASAALG